MYLKKLLCFALIIVVALSSCNGQPKKGEKETIRKEPAKSNLPAPDSSNKLMNENEFWKIIEKSGVDANNSYQKQITSLKTILLQLDPSGIQAFDNTFTSLLAVSYDAKLWGAAYVINGGCSDDCFDYFRQYLIAHGKNKFYQTLKDPESCVSWIKSEEEDPWQGLQYSAPDAYKQKTGHEISKTYNPAFELKGKPFDEETLMKQYPKLAKKFMEGN